MVFAESGLVLLLYSGLLLCMRVHGWIAARAVAVVLVAVVDGGVFLVVTVVGAQSVNDVDVSVVVGVFCGVVVVVEVVIVVVGVVVAHLL